jgi:two-component system chemotaxis sensor kinase CheA
VDLSRYTALFLSESREQLGACAQALLDWEQTPGAEEPRTRLFRAMHSFKGMAAAMGYTNLAALAHRTESVLERARDGALTGHELTDLCLRVVDALERGAPLAAEGGDAGLDFGPLVRALDQLAVPGTPGQVEPPPGPVREGAEGAGGAAKSREVKVRIQPSAVMRGARAMLVLRRAETLGGVSGVRPPAGVLEQDGFDGRFAFRLVSDLDDAAVTAALVQVGDVASVEIGATGDDRSGEGGGRGRQIRIDLRRLDKVMNLVSELVVAKGRLNDLVDPQAAPELYAVNTRISRIASDLYSEVIETRLTPVWQVFDRFPRVVRDLARQLGRRVRLEVEGEETQLDRAILDELGEPLIHLLRNAIDHGIESPAERRRAGKPEEGLIRVTASSDRTTVLIRVSDDGAGIDRSQVLAAAVGAGHLPPETTALDNDLLLRVLSRPGFSTARQVTDVSGRGVGMDAVVSRVRVLGGSVELDSQVGVGSVFTLRLPMTLAIVRALLAGVGREQYAIPLAGIAETVEYRAEQLEARDGAEAFRLRDELLPAVRLRQRLGVTGYRPPGRPPVVIVEVGERRAAVLVDSLLGQQEIVVEPFDAPKGTLPLFSGATILGDGVPALIVDPAALV